MISRRETVDVLLTTYNGEKYVEVMLDSILSQESVELEIHISDAGSTDRTIEILRVYAEKYSEIRIYNNPGFSSSQNFLFLLSQSRNNYIAFADQDDIWTKDHLINSIIRLEEIEAPLKLSYSNVEIISDKKLNTRRHEKPLTHKINSLFMQNFAQGCTFVIDREVVEVALSLSDDFMVMYDWWLALLVSTYGNVVYSNQREVFYRIHDNNTIGLGSKKKRINSIFKLARNTPWQPIRQLEGIMKHHKLLGETPNFEIMRHFFAGATGCFFDRLHFIFNYRNRIRKTAIEDLNVRILILLGIARRTRLENEE